MVARQLSPDFVPAETIIYSDKILEGKNDCLTHIGNILGFSPSVIHGNKIQK